MLYPQNNKKRNSINLSGFWNFQKDPQQKGEEELWYKGLPHPREIAVNASWNEQYIDLFQYFGKGWYQTHAFIPENWNESVWLRIGAVFYKAQVWIGNHYLGLHEGGSLPFEYDISSFVQVGCENRITVLVDGTLDPWGLPQSLLTDHKEERTGFVDAYPAVNYDFYPYAGIHRPVVLYHCPKNRIEQIKITTTFTKVNNQFNATIHALIETTHPFTGSIIVSCKGEEVQKKNPQENKTPLDLNLTDVILWDMKNPALYDLVVTLVQSEGEIVDTYRQAFGIRSIEIQENALLLNGKKIFLKGFGKHEDLAIIGKGLSPSSIVKDFDLMHWIGANSLRTSHYPYSEEFLSYADRHGMLVIGETPFVGLRERMYTKEISHKANDIIKQMITRDFNHPCIIAWSLANEPVVQTEKGKIFFKSMSETAKREDASRPVMYVAHMDAQDNVGMEYYDLLGLNKYYGWYIGPGQIDQAQKAISDCLDTFHSAFKKPMILTEFGADAVEGMHQLPATMFSEEYQSKTIELTYHIATTKSYIVGAHVWCFADFMTSQSIARVGMNRKGVFTRERKPKMAAYTLRELWKEPKA
jgi:beta-glucuronidase